MIDDMSPTTVILGMAIVTVLTRYVGYMVLGHYRLSQRAQSILEAVPVSVLTAIIAPVVLTTGPAESLAAIATLIIAWRLPTVVAIVVGVVIVVALRMVF